MISKNDNMLKEMPQKIMCKVIVAGDGGVGKTTLLKRFVDGTFDMRTNMTIGVEIHQKSVEIPHNMKVDLVIWDFGGQERFRFLLDSFMNGASGAILMFDPTRIMTLFNLVEWIDLVRNYDPNLPIILIAGKMDLLDGPFCDEDKAIEFQHNNNIQEFFKVSSKTGENVNEAFSSLVNDILRYKNIQIVENYV